MDKLPAIECLKDYPEPASAWKEALWDAILASQGEIFTTSGRGKGENKRPGVDFSYTVKISQRTGRATDELLISRKEKSKTITRSTVEMAFENAMDVRENEGGVKGPKKLKVFGASYLYAIFKKWELI